MATDINMRQMLDGIKRGSVAASLWREVEDAQGRRIRRGEKKHTRGETSHRRLAAPVTYAPGRPLRTKWKAIHCL